MLHLPSWNEIREDRKYLYETTANEERERRKQEHLDKNCVEPNVRSFKARPNYPRLPSPYRWKTQKNSYCPKDMLNEVQKNTRRKTLKETLNHKYGYVFCHRGLYDRGRDIIENSATAIKNGLNQEMYLHEVDCFIPHHVNDAIIAHDQKANGVTTEKKHWESMHVTKILKTQLVSKPVNMDTKDFAVQHQKTADRVPGLMSVIWKEYLKPTGITLQIDLRDDDFAKILAYYSYHIGTTNSSHEGLEHKLFRATMFKGYNYHYPSFSALETAIERESMTRWNKNWFETSHLHHLPPLIMVFSAEALDKLARENISEGSNPTYKQLRSTIMNQVASFVHIGKDKYNFILEIGHSGLGLGYDRSKHEARNPLDGKPIYDEKVKYQSLLDRAMIDVSLKLRKKYPELLFASCTRLPNAILPGGEKCKIGYATAKIEGWGTGEGNIASELRAIHGGLYPQSDIAIADDAVAEIAARTWIDQKVKLKREELLRVPYKEWIRKGGKDLIEAIGNINGHLLNRVGNLLEQSDRAQPHDKNTVPIEKIQFWPMLNAAPDASGDWSTVFRDNPSLDEEKDVFDNYNQCEADPYRDLPDVDIFSEYVTVGGRDNGDKFNPRVGVFDPSGYLTILTSGPNDETSILPTKGGHYIFDSLSSALGKSNTMRLYDRVVQIGPDELKNLIKNGADINALAGPDGTALAAACGVAQPSINKLRLLLEHGAAVSIEGRFGYPLHVMARKRSERGVELLLNYSRSQFLHQHLFPDKIGIKKSMVAAFQDKSVYESIRQQIATAYQEIIGSNIPINDDAFLQPGLVKKPKSPTQALFSRARPNQWRFGEGSPPKRIENCGRANRVNHCDHRVQDCRCAHTDCALCLTSQRTTQRD